MSDNVRGALESHLATISNPLPTEYEGVSFTPENDVAYQSAYLLDGGTDDLCLAFDGRYKLTGIFQITLRYPTGQGSGGAESEALRLISHFARGTVLTKNNMQVRILKTPIKKNLGIEADRLLRSVRVSFEAYNLI